MKILVIALILVSISLFLSLRIIFGIICGSIALGKGRSAKKNFWLGFFLGFIGLTVVALKPKQTIVLNPILQQNLMHITWLWRCGALTNREFEREKNVLYWVNHRM